MTVEDYAARIYSELNLRKDNKDLYVKGVLDTIKKLDKRKQQALEYYYRYDMSFRQVGDKMGLSAGQVNYSVKKAMLILRHPYNSRNMHVD